MSTTSKDTRFGLAPDESVELAARLTRSARRLVRDLVRVRAERKMSLAEVADAIGIHKSGVSRFEGQEKSPRLDTLLRYAHSVGADIHFLVEPIGGWDEADSSVITHLNAWKGRTEPQGKDPEDDSAEEVFEKRLPLAL